MNGRRFTEVLDDEMLREASDDEAVDDESEDILGDIASGIGTILNPLTPILAPINAVRNIVSPPTPLQPARPSSIPGGGVSTAVVTGPGGRPANLNFQQPVVAIDDLRQMETRLIGLVNTERDRINSLQQNVIPNLGQQVSAVSTRTQRDIARLRREHRTDLRRQGQQFNSQLMNFLMLSLVTGQQQQRDFEDHTHGGVTAGPATTDSPTQTGRDNSFTSMLPFLMLSGEGGMGGSGSDGGMNMAMLALAFMR